MQCAPLTTARREAVVYQQAVYKAVSRARRAMRSIRRVTLFCLLLLLLMLAEVREAANAQQRPKRPCSSSSRGTRRRAWPQRPRGGCGRLHILANSSSQKQQNCMQYRSLLILQQDQAAAAAQILPSSSSARCRRPSPSSLSWTTRGCEAVCAYYNYSRLVSKGARSEGHGKNDVVSQSNKYIQPDGATVLEARLYKFFFHKNFREIHVMKK